MGISLFVGRPLPQQRVDENYAMIRDLMRQFEERFGSTNCKVLLGCDLDTPEGQQVFTANHLIERCYDYAEGATRIAVSLLQERDSKTVSQ